MEVLKAQSTNCSKHQRDELTMLTTLYPGNAPSAFRARDLILRNLGNQGKCKKGQKQKGRGPKTKENFKPHPRNTE